MLYSALCMSEIDTCISRTHFNAICLLAGAQRPAGRTAETPDEAAARVAAATPLTPLEQAEKTLRARELARTLPNLEEKPYLQF